MKRCIVLTMMLAWSGWLSSIASAGEIFGVLSSDEVFWNRYALTASLGYVDNPVTLNAANGWRRTRLGSSGELGADLTMYRTLHREVSVGVSLLHASGTVGREPGVENENSTLSFNTTTWALRARTRFYGPRRWFPVDPWWGLGVSGGTMTAQVQERVATPSGFWTPASRDILYPYFGASALAGFDVRPARDASLLLRLEARYDLNIFTKSFNGHANGYAVLLGLHWRFWPMAL